MPRFDVRLTSAAVRARDDLRLVILPGLATLAPALSGNAEAAALLGRLQRLAHAHADGLRLAVKDRKRRKSSEINLPCWANTTNGKDRPGEQ